MGEHLRQVVRQDEGSAAAVERRFTALLSAHPDDLHFYLRQAVSFLQSKDVPVDWHQLFNDVRWWGHSERRVQRQWARSFWGYSPDSNPSDREG